jgi:hypothetical protein
VLQALERRVDDEALADQPRQLSFDILHVPAKALNAGSFFCSACQSPRICPTRRQISCASRPSRGLASRQRARKLAASVGQGSTRQARAKAQIDQLPPQFVERAERHELHRHLVEPRQVLLEILELLAKLQHEQAQQPRPCAWRASSGESKTHSETLSPSSTSPG